MDSYNVIHTIGNLNFSGYTYFYIIVDGAAVIKGESITTTGPINIPVTISNASEISGVGVKGLIGKIKPQELARGPIGQGGLNTDGTWNIKG
mgnify:FL=1|jgi:hypothetical protein